MNKKKKVKIVLLSILIIGTLASVSKNKNDSDVKESKENETLQTEESKELQEVETDAYGWSVNDYQEFYVAIRMIANNYLEGYKMPSYDKWQFARFDDEGRIFAMTEELTFKGRNEKHIMICVFSLSGEVKENGLHEKVNCNFFGTDQRTYYDDGSCDEVFERIIK